jgi:hypothetical protein
MSPFIEESWHKLCISHIYNVCYFPCPFNHAWKERLYNQCHISGISPPSTPTDAHVTCHSNSCVVCCGRNSVRTEDSASTSVCSRQLMVHNDVSSGAGTVPLFGAIIHTVCLSTLLPSFFLSFFLCYSDLFYLLVGVDDYCCMSSHLRTHTR